VFLFFAVVEEDTARKKIRKRMIDPVTILAFTSPLFLKG